MTGRVPRLLAKITAGTPPPDGPGGGSIKTVNEVMAAMGMGKAGRLGSMILLANYCDDTDSRRWAEAHLVRWAWLTWLKVGDKAATVTAGQMTRLVSVAVGQHIDPEAGRRTSLKAVAELIGINHQTYAHKYLDHFKRVQAEIAYQESQAISALEARL